LVNGGPPELPQKRTISKYACSVSEERLVIEPTFDFSFGIFGILRQVDLTVFGFFRKLSLEIFAPFTPMFLVGLKILTIASFLL